MDWAGKIRIINIEKAEPALGGISIEYTDCFEVEGELKSILTEMDEYPWGKAGFENIVKTFSRYMAKLWKVHPFREGNGRCQRMFIEHLCYSAGYRLDFIKITGKEMLEASVKAFDLEYDMMEQLIFKSLSKE